MSTRIKELAVATERLLKLAQDEDDIGTFSYMNTLNHALDEVAAFSSSYVNPEEDIVATMVFKPIGVEKKIPARIEDVINRAYLSEEGRKRLKFIVAK